MEMDDVDCSLVPFFKESSEESSASDDDARQAPNIPETLVQRFANLKKRREAMTATMALLTKANKSKKRRKRGQKEEAVLLDGRHKLSNNSDVQTEARWIDVRQFLDVNSHLSGPVGHGVRQPKSGLEENVNEAISKGEFEKAEQLSERLATREFAVRAANAFAARRFADEKEREKKTRLKTRKRLHWGFETKHRWEMKGNM